METEDVEQATHHRRTNPASPRSTQGRRPFVLVPQLWKERLP